MTIALGILAFYGWLLLCWVLYISVMAFRAQRDNLHPLVKAHAYVVLGIGLAFDLILTVVIGSVLFLAPPKDLTLTGRLKRHRAEGGWRGNVAGWLCTNLLNPFTGDKEGHC